MFDPVFCPDQKADPDAIAARSKKAAIYAWLAFLFIFIKCVATYEYVERNAIIPQQWWDSIISTCPVWKKSHTFHNFTLVHTGYVVMMPALFLMNYLKHRRWAKTGVPPIETPQVVRAAYWIEVITKVTAFALIDVLIKKTTVAIYGTTNIEPYPGFFKVFIQIFMLAFVAGPCTQLIRRELAAKFGEERKKQD